MQVNPYPPQQQYNAPQGYPQPQPGYGGYQPAAPAAAAGYEFTHQENGIIGSTAGWTRGAGAIQLLLGALMLISGMYQWSSGIVALGGVQLAFGTVYAVVGASLLSAGGSLGSVVKTQGGDIMHMMRALVFYQRAFKIQVIVAVLAFGFGLLLGLRVIR